MDRSLEMHLKKQTNTPIIYYYSKNNNKFFLTITIFLIPQSKRTLTKTLNKNISCNSHYFRLLKTQNGTKTTKNKERFTILNRVIFGFISSSNPI